MHNTFIINNIGLDRKYTDQRTQHKHQEFKGSTEQPDNKSSKMVIYTLVGLAAVSTTGIIINNLKHGKVKTPEVHIQVSPKPIISTNSLPKKISLEGLEKFITSELPVDNDIYRFMKRNPRGFYLEYGKEVNKFLRKGTFEDLPIDNETLPPELRKILQNKIKEQKELNRTIIESIEAMDSKITSKTTEPMTVYRDAPRQWMNTEKNGVLTDPAYLSTSTERGASMEGVICNGADNFTYEIRLPKGTPYWDMTDTAEKEMLLPRNSKFKIIAPGILELIL